MAKKTAKELSKVSHQGYEHISMSPSQAIKAMKMGIEADITVQLWGSPGVGKTSICRQVAEELGFDSAVVINPSQIDLIDIKFPYLAEKESNKKEKVSKFALNEIIPQTGRHLICVDELNTCMPGTAPMWYSLTLEKRIGTHKLPDEFRVCATGNRTFDKSAAQPMQLAQKDRMMHINVRPSTDDSYDWGSKRGVDPAILAFIKDNEGQAPLECADPDDPAGGCTARSLMETLDKALKTGIPREVEQQIIEGIIGQAMGTQFSAYLDIFRNQIDLDEIIKNPETYKIPEKTDVKYCIATGLASKTNKKNIKNVLKFVNRMEKTYMVLTVMDFINRNPELKVTREFSDFAIKNTNLFNSI